MYSLTTLPMAGAQTRRETCEGGSCGCTPRRRGWEIAAGAALFGHLGDCAQVPPVPGRARGVWSGLGLSLAAATLVRWSLLTASALLLSGALLLRWRRVSMRTRV